MSDLINGHDPFRPDPPIALICDLAFGALQGIVEEFTDDEDTANALMEEVLRNAWERLGDCEEL